MTAIRAYMWDRAGAEGIILCGRQYMNSLDDSSMGEIKAAIRGLPWLAPHFDIGEKYIRTRSGRIAYKFSGLDLSLDSIKSKARIKLCWVDEAEPVLDEAWMKLIPTLREEDSELWVTWNPESKRSATHRRFREAKPHPRRKIVDMNWRDNPWFPAILDRRRREDMKERPDRYDHVWEGGFRQVYEGAYYAAELNRLKAEGRIGSFPADPDLPVHTVWDLGKGAHMSVWLFQLAPNGIRVVEYIEGVLDEGIPSLVAKITARSHKWGHDWVPHDAKVKEIGTERTRLEVMRRLRGKEPKLVPDHRVADGIEAVRQTLPRCWFHEPATETGLDALRHYRSSYDEKNLVFSETPKHDWASHAADAFRYLAMAWRETVLPRPAAKVPHPGTFEVSQLGDGGVGLGVTFDEMTAARRRRAREAAE
jgi:phage terminase large subunit